MDRTVLCDALRSKWFLTAEHIDAILSDREYFQPYLKEALARRVRVGGASESPLDATDCQAIFLLAEMGDTEMIADLLQCLRMDGDDLRKLYGDSLTEHMWIPFAKAGHGRLDEIMAFVLDEAADEYARSSSVLGVIAMPHFRPESRNDVVQFIHRLLAHPTAFPTDHMAGILCDCADWGLTELRETALRFADRMTDSEDEIMPMATAEDVRRAFRESGRVDPSTRRPHDVFGVNTQWQHWAEREEGPAAQLGSEWISEHAELIHQVDEAAQNRFTKKDPRDSSARLRAEYDLAMRLADVITTEEELDRVEDHVKGDVGSWLVELPFTLAAAGLVEEALELGRIWAGVTARDNFLGDRVVMLAEAGMREEALRQMLEVMREFPDDVWVWIKCGDARLTLGDAPEAERFFRHALAMARERDDRLGALERLIRMMDQRGRKEEAAEFEATYRAISDFHEKVQPEAPALQPGLPRNIGPKIGRNDPCPCGSGKKYKKCCGG